MISKELQYYHERIQIHTFCYSIWLHTINFEFYWWLNTKNGIGVEAEGRIDREERRVEYGWVGNMRLWELGFEW